jgi:hypothetical protein
MHLKQPKQVKKTKKRSSKALSLEGEGWVRVNKSAFNL